MYCKYSAIRLSKIWCCLQEPFEVGSSSSSWISGTVERAVVLWRCWESWDWALCNSVAPKLETLRLVGNSSNGSTGMWLSTCVSCWAETLRMAVDMCKTGVRAGGRAVLVERRISGCKFVFEDGVAFKRRAFAAKSRLELWWWLIESDYSQLTWKTVSKAPFGCTVSCWEERRLGGICCFDVLRFKLNISIYTCRTREPLSCWVSTDQDPVPSTKMSSTPLNCVEKKKTATWRHIAGTALNGRISLR